MINVRFDLCTREDTTTYEMRLDGHASEDDSSSLLCASATILAYTLAQCIKNEYESGNLECKPQIELEEGHAVVCATPKAEHFYKLSAMYETIMFGYAVLKQNYPKVFDLFVQ